MAHPSRPTDSHPIIESWFTKKHILEICYCGHIQAHFRSWTLKRRLEQLFVHRSTTSHLSRQYQIRPHEAIWSAKTGEALKRHHIVSTPRALVTDKSRQLPPDRLRAAKKKFKVQGYATIRYSSTVTELLGIVTTYAAHIRQRVKAMRRLPTSKRPHPC